MLPVPIHLQLIKKSFIRGNITSLAGPIDANIWSVMWNWHCFNNNFSYRYLYEAGQVSLRSVYSYLLANDQTVYRK